MTIEQFLQRFARKLKREETRGTMKAGLILDRLRIFQKNRDDCLCPLEFVAGTPEGTANTAAQRKLGLSNKQADRIIYAADDVSYQGKKFESLRARLLKAAGLAS